MADHHILYFPIDPCNCNYYTKDLFIQYLFIQNSGPSQKVPEEKKINFRKENTDLSVSGRVRTDVLFWQPSLLSAARRSGDPTLHRSHPVARQSDESSLSLTLFTALVF